MQKRAVKSLNNFAMPACYGLQRVGRNYFQSLTDISTAPCRTSLPTSTAIAATNKQLPFNYNQQHPSGNPGSTEVRSTAPSEAELAGCLLQIASSQYSLCVREKGQQDALFIVILFHLNYPRHFYRCAVHFEIHAVHSPTNALFIKSVRNFKFTLKCTTCGAIL